MDANSEIIIDFTETQETEIIQKCGFIPKSIVTNGLSLMMLSLAATAKNSDVLPLVNRISTSNQILDSNGRNQSYSVVLELSAEQSEKIKNIVNKDWKKVAIVPDDYEVNYKQIWESEPPIQHIGNTFVIVSEGTEFTPSNKEIVIKLPGINETNNHTFGTGSHPATQNALKLLKEYLKPGTNVADIGTGSGILAVAAAKLGAKEVLAFDIDEKSVKTAEAITKLNDIEEIIRVELGSIELMDENYDLVIGNLFPKIIVAIADSLADKIKPEGILILSGIVSARLPQITNLMQELGFELLETKIIDFWGGLAFQKKDNAKI